MHRRDLVFDTITDLVQAKPDIISLVETKLTQSIKQSKSKTFQTSFAPKWGCWQSHTSGSGHTMIKKLASNFIWVISNYEGVPLHTLTIYLPPSDTQVINLYVRQLRYVVE